MNRRGWIDPQLAAVPLFRGLSKAQLRLVSSLATPLEFPAGKVLVTEGRGGYEFILVEEGVVEIWKAGRIVATRGPGEFVGEIALIEGRPRTASVVAATPVVVHVIGRREFSALLDQVPELAEQIRATARERLGTLSSA
jgi:CRP-like cAMP-binding protein